MVTATQVLREFNHVHPQDDEEGKVFVNARVSCFVFVFDLTCIFLVS